MSSFCKEVEGKQLLVLAPPIKANEYYKEKFFDVIPFYVNYVGNVTGKDDVILVVDEETMPYYEGKIHQSKLIMDHIDDPWVRDVSLPIPSKDVQFTYVGGSTLKEARNTQSIFDKFIHEIGIATTRTDLLLDGGNLVNNNNNKVITSRKFLTDNNLTEQQGVDELKHLLNVTHVSILTPDEPKLGHSDGMAAYVCDDVIYMHKQLEPNHTMYRNELLKGCPDCTIVEIEGFFDDRTFKEGYASSCGVYVNCVVTDAFIYMPIFNHERDADAIFKFRNNPCNKTVVPIDVTTVCEMGGSLRCLSWQTQGEMAEKIMKAAQRNSSQTLSLSRVMFFLMVIFTLMKRDIC